MTIDTKNITVLLVEDAAAMRRIEVKILNSLGFVNVIEAPDGLAALTELAQRDDIDLIISDWNMPNLGGYELLIQVRGMEKFKDMPFIMATGQADRSQAEKATAAGANAFIPKPFSPEELNDKISQALGEGQVVESSVAAGPVLGVSGKVKIRVAHIQITDHLVLGVLKDKIDKGEISPRYFELETHRMPGWNPVEQALDKGKVDVAFILAPLAQDLFGAGVPIKLTLLAHRNGSIMVRNGEGGYVEPFSGFFQDKSFLIPHKLSVHHMLAHMFFEKMGLPASLEKGEDIKVNFEVVAPINMGEFLASSPRVSGFLVAEPLGSRAVANGIAERQFLSSELWANHPCCVVAMREDFMDGHDDAAQEFIRLLVECGKYIDNFPAEAAEIGVQFLDPVGNLGLRSEVLTKVLTDPLGIKTSDLFPVILDFDVMQRYLHDRMGIGRIVDLEKFIDTRYAEAACEDMSVTSATLHNTADTINEILRRSAPALPALAKQPFMIRVENGLVEFYRQTV